MNVRKKVTMVIMVMTTMCSLTGCISSKERSDIIDKLESKSIIKRDWEKRQRNIMLSILSFYG